MRSRRAVCGSTGSNAFLGKGGPAARVITGFTTTGLRTTTGGDVATTSGGDAFTCRVGGARRILSSSR